MVETEEGSNTAITTQLISIGVMERISVTSSMFTQPGRESSSEEEEESVGGGGSDPSSNLFIHSVIN